MDSPEAVAKAAIVRNTQRGVWLDTMDPNLKLDDWIGRTVSIVIDRPLGSVHPNHPGIVYGVNYGHIPGTVAPDGHPIDAYVLGVDYPLDQCSAKVIAAIRRRDDIEDKIVVAMSGEWDEASISKATEFQEQWFDSWVELRAEAN